MKPDFGIFLAERKVVQFFADKVVLFLSLLILSFIVIDSFIHLLPYGNGTVQCFIESNNVASGQQSYIDAYCADYVPWRTFLVPIVIFIHGLTTVLLHYAWYSTVLYANRFVKATGKDAKPEEVRKEINTGASGDSVNTASSASKATGKDAKPEEVGSGSRTADIEMAPTAEKQAAKKEDSAAGNEKGVVAASSRGRSIWLLICYGIKNFLQAAVAMVAVWLSFDYEFNESSILSLNKTFLCPIKGQGNIDYWTDLDTVQCFYSSVALNDVFLIYSTASCQSVCSLQPHLDFLIFV